MNVLDGFPRDAGAAVGAVLDEAIVLARSGDDLASLEHVVGAGLLYVDVFPRLAGPDGLEGVVMVRGGDGDGVDGFIFQELANIGVHGRAFLAGFFQVGDAGVLHGFVDVADGGDLHVGHGSIAGDVHLTLPVNADASDTYGIIGAGRQGGTSCGAGGQRTH